MLQTRLLDSAFVALKVGGEMVYSTCTLNQFENEGVIDALEKRHPGAFEVLFQRRFWPHRDEAGGFFITRLRKVRPVEHDIPDMKELTGSPHIRHLSHAQEIALDTFSRESGLSLEGFDCFAHESDIRIFRSHPELSKLQDTFYFLRFGERIGSADGRVFTPDYILGRDFSLPGLPTFELPDDLAVNEYLTGRDIVLPEFSLLTGGTVRITHQGIPYGLGTLESETRIIKNSFPREWRRK